MDSIIPVMLCAKPDVLKLFLIMLSCWLSNDPYTEVNISKVLKLCLCLWGYIWLHLVHHIETPVPEMWYSWIIHLAMSWKQGIIYALSNSFRVKEGRGILVGFWNFLELHKERITSGSNGISELKIQWVCFYLSSAFSKLTVHSFQLMGVLDCFRLSKKRQLFMMRSGYSTRLWWMIICLTAFSPRST